MRPVAKTKKAAPALPAKRTPNSGYVISLILIISGILIGGGMIGTVCTVWYMTGRFGLGGALLSLLGVALVGLTIWGKVHIKAGAVEVRLEHNKETIKRMSLLVIVAAGSIYSLAIHTRYSKAVRLEELLRTLNEQLESKRHHSQPRSINVESLKVVIGGFKERNTEIPPIAEADRLKALIEYAKKNHENIVITGYSDSTLEDYAVSLLRANRVKDFLVEQGILSDHIFTDSRGPEYPIASNSTTEGRAKNRRVEIEIK